MKETFFRSMAWLHTWVGLLVCWLLFLIFFAGTLSYFRHDITFWSQPTLHDIQHQIEYDERELITHSFNSLTNTHSSATSWFIALPTDRQPALVASARVPVEGSRRGKFESTYIDPNSLEVLPPPPETKGGNFFYRLHFDLHYMDVRTARWIVCFASLFMLIALISGVIIHKRIFKDLFQFRSGKGVRTWLDGHNISSVLALPFHIMITYTGIITLIFMLFPYSVNSLYQDGRSGFNNDLNPTRITPDKLNIPLQEIKTDTILDHFYTNWPTSEIARVSVANPYDQAAVVKIYLDNGTQLRDNRAVSMYSAFTGELLALGEHEQSASEAFFDGMIAVHSGRVAMPELRWLYFFCGLAGCFMIATGSVMWAKRLRERMKKDQQAGAGLKLVETLNLATIMGLPLATAGFFIANRLLPTDINARSDKEVLVFFSLWSLCLLIALFKRNTQAWSKFAMMNVIAWASLPFISAIATGSTLFTHLANAQWTLASFDIAFLVTAMLFFYQRNLLNKQSIQVDKVSHHRKSIKA